MSESSSAGDAAPAAPSIPPGPALPPAPRALPAWAPWVLGGGAGFVLGVVVGVVIALLGSVVVSAASAARVDPRFADAIEECGGENVGMYLDDDGATLVLDVRGEDESSGASYLDYYCLESELGMPGRIASHVGQTTSLDGRQSDEWDGIRFSWSYHPDRGLDGVFEYTG